MADAEGISLEETNKIRISLGLKPLTEDKAPGTDKEKEAEDNYSRVREQAAKEKADKALKDKIAKVRNKHELNARLKGTTLGDPDDTDDTRAWLKKSKKREKELAKKRQKELEEMDKVFAEDYTEKDLEGLKVGHDLDDLAEGEEQILTLKDSRILDNEEDELQNVLAAEHNRTKQRVELMTKKKGYTGYDDEEFVSGREGMRRSVLAKYDTELEGPEETGFRLGETTRTAQAVRQEKVEAAAAVNKTLLSIDYLKNQEMTDYLQEGDAGFKKLKKKKKKPRATRQAEESDIIQEVPGETMEVDQPEATAPLRNVDTNFIDDDDLQLALARSRRAKMMKKPKLSPEEIARRVAEEKAEAEQQIKAEDEEVGLVIDDTSEFVNGITLEAKEARVITISSVKRETSADDDAMDEDEREDVDIKKEEEEMQAALMALENVYGKHDEKQEAEQAEDEIEVGTAGEKTHNAGLGSTLSILKAQGVIRERSKEEHEREQTQRQQDFWLAENRARQALRELERAQSRGVAKDQYQREYENRLREQQEARDNLELFKNYKPDVNIVYHDEFGRVLTPKEAWKALSHKFHGKGSGRMKTEKRLKRIEDEKKMMAMSSSDTPLSMTKAFQLRQEKTGQAHMVLSVGNRGAAPQLEKYLDNQTLAKKTDKKGKKGKDGTGKDDQLVDMTDLVTANNNSQTAAGVTNSNGGTPAPRAGFKQIGSFVSKPATTTTDTSAGGSVPTLGGAIRLKRKAEDEGAGTPPSKRRL